MSELKVEKGEKELTDQGYAQAAELQHHGSWWPIFLAFGVGLMPTGVLLYVWAGKFGLFLLALGGVLTLFGIGGWLNVLIKEKLVHLDAADREAWSRNAIKLFLVSEAAIFGALFTHHYYARAHFPTWPPQGAPHLDTTIPFIATLLLVASSFTMERAHKFLLKGKQFASQRWVSVTILLGAIFLSCQAYEWGFLKTFDEFTLKSGTFGTSFFMMTGFHGLHVSMGLMVLMLTFVRLKLGHFTPTNHFFLVGSTWYWHFVDIVWVFLFGTMYLL